MTPQEVRDLQAELGLSLRLFARLVPCHVTSLMRWRAGTAAPGRLARRRLAEIRAKHARRKAKEEAT